MKYLIILFSIISLELCVECGLLKGIIGSVTNEVNKISEGDNILINVANIVKNETKGLVNDLGELLDITQTNKNGKTTMVEVNEVENNVTAVMGSNKKIETGVTELETNLPLRKPKIDVRINAI